MQDTCSVHKFNGEPVMTNILLNKFVCTLCFSKQVDSSLHFLFCFGQSQPIICIVSIDGINVYSRRGVSTNANNRRIEIIHRPLHYVLAFAMLSFVHIKMKHPRSKILLYKRRDRVKNKHMKYKSNHLFYFGHCLINQSVQKKDSMKYFHSTIHVYVFISEQIELQSSFDDICSF